MTSPAAAVAAADHGVRAAMPLELLPDRRNPIVVGTAADSPRLPHARFLPPLSSQQKNARGYWAARLCPTNPPGRVHTAGVRLLPKCADVFPSFPIPPHLLSPRPSAAAAFDDAAAVAECTRPRRAT